MKLIVGLGNPGKKYEKNRHNLGFMVLDYFLSSKKYPKPKLDKKFNAEILKQGDIIFAEPQTFMNNSGSSVSAISQYFKIKPKDILVLHDDIDFPQGTIKIAHGDSAAGHNGIASISENINTNKFWRLRIGILSKPKTQINVERFVLSDFTKQESAAITKIIQTAKEVIDDFCLNKKIEHKKIVIR